MAHSERHGAGRERRRDRPLEAFTTGLTFTVVFGALTVFGHGTWWLVFPLVFAGILPMVRGISGMVSRRAAGLAGAYGRDNPLPPPSAASVKSDAEKELLLVAKESDGVITPAIAALKTSLSIDAADEILQDLARRGHATMVVGDDGHVEYQFPEFRPRTGLGPGEDTKGISS
jgi:hypothetical protein